MKKILPFLMTLLFAFACNMKEPVPQNTSTADLTYEVISITGMSCTGCEETITAGVAALEGVQDSKADYVEGKAWVSYDASSTGHEQLTSAIESKGYKVTGFEALAADSATALLN